MAYQYIESVKNKYVGNPSHLAHQGLADIKAVFPGYAAFSTFLA